MKTIVLLGVLFAGVTACGASDSEIAAKEADVRNRGFTVMSSGDGGIGGDVYVHVVFGENNKCSGTVWYNGDRVTLQASLSVPNSVEKKVDFSIDDPQPATLPEKLASTDCFTPPNTCERLFHSLPSPHNA